MLLGRAKDHNTDVHRFLNLTTRKVITSRDVLWLNKTYGVWKGIGQPTHVEPESDEDEELLDPQRRVTRATTLRENQTEFVPITPLPDTTEEDLGETMFTPPPTNPKLATAMRQLGGWFNPEADAYNAKVRFTKDVHPPDGNRTQDPPAIIPRDQPVTTVQPVNQSGRDDAVSPDSASVLIDCLHAGRVRTGT